MTWLQYVFKFASTSAQANIAAGQQEAVRQSEKANAANLEQEARDVGSVAARNEDQARREYRQFAGEQFAAMAETGLANEGSLLDVARDSESAALLDALNIRYAGASQARALRFGAAQARYRSKVAAKMATRVKMAVHLQGITEAMGGMGGGNAASAAWKGASAGESASNWNGGSVGGGGFGATYGA